MRSPAAERVHLIGLVSDGGVHSGWSHIEALIRLGAELGVPDLVVHAFTDGRDTFPNSGAGYLATVQGWMDERRGRAGSGRSSGATTRWTATSAGTGSSSRTTCSSTAVRSTAPSPASRRAGTRTRATRPMSSSRPMLVGEEALIRPGDSVFGINFRPDRMREITRALADPSFTDVDRGGAAVVETFACMTQYEEGWPYPVAFPPEHPSTTMSTVLEAHHVRQLHVAETEKYPHVTYFFNGGNEDPCDGERRELVPSPRDVPTYDYKPEMSAHEAAQAFVDAWKADSPTFGIINFANADMVGHTGVIPAAVKAIETVDGCLGEVVAAVHEAGGACLITADHGNADHMLEPDGSPNTAHSLNPVPVIVTVPGLSLRDGGVLADVAPTLLQLLGYRRSRRR